MNNKKYQELTRTTNEVNPENRMNYLVCGLCSEAGEVAGKWKKLLRGDGGVRNNIFAEELGDVLWYVSELCNELGVNIGDVMEGNIKKLKSRKERGVIKGDGDNR